MPSRLVIILDTQDQIVATAHVAEEGGAYSGLVDVARMPETLRLQFEEYETIVNDQMLSLLDQIEEQIAATPFVARFDDGTEAKVADLQIFPRGGTVFFRAIEPAAVNSHPLASTRKAHWSAPS